MFRISAPALLLAVFFSTNAPAEQFSGRMIFNSKEARVLGLRTADGMVALGHAPDMKLTGISSLNDAKVCDELQIEATAGGPALLIRNVTFKSAGKAEECPFPTATFVPAARLYQALQDKSAVVYDVRSAEEFNKAHFEGAINLPLPEVAGRLKELPADKPILLYCASARRSAFAAVILQQKGIKAGVVKGKFVIKDGKPQIVE
jgi:rhodanese-related sulfurtransferase